MLQNIFQTIKMQILFLKKIHDLSLLFTQGIKVKKDESIINRIMVRMHAQR